MINGSVSSNYMLCFNQGVSSKHGSSVVSLVIITLFFFSSTGYLAVLFKSHRSKPGKKVRVEAGIHYD